MKKPRDMRSYDFKTDSMSLPWMPMHTHNHMLRALNNSLIDAHKICATQVLNPK